MIADLRSLRALFASVAAIHLATAALNTLVALEIATKGGTQESASLVAASYSLGFLLGCFFIARPLASIGSIRAFATAAAVCTISTLLLWGTDSLATAMLARLATGCGTASLYAVADAWISKTAGAAVRGRVLALYAVVLGVATVLSQAFVGIWSDDIARSLVIMAGLYCLAIVLLVPAQTDPPPYEERSSVRVRTVLRYSPTAVVGALAIGMVTVILLSVVPYRAFSIGVSSSAIALGIGALYFGKLALQYPLGRASDGSDRRILVAAASLSSALLMVLLTVFAPGGGAALEGRAGPAAFLAVVGALAFLGGGLLSLFSLLVAHAMDRAPAGDVSYAATTLLFVQTIGGVAGALLAAVASALFGDASVNWIAAAIMLAVAAFTVLRIALRPPTLPAERAVHVPSVQTSVDMVPTEKR